VTSISEPFYPKYTNVRRCPFVYSGMRGIAICALLAGVLGAQPRFEVATVRLTSEAEQASGSAGVTTGKGRYSGKNLTLKEYLIRSYGVSPNQIVGGPDWLGTARWDIQAKAEQPIDDDDAIMLMVQTLLTDRFQLKIRRDDREMRAYMLEVAKNGLKAQKSAPGTEYNTNYGRGKLEATGTTLPHLAQRLGRQLDLPVVDKTGIEGAFDFKLNWTPDGAKADPAAPPGIFTAIQEQLGLKLTGARAAVPVLVIESAAMPGEN
jgi:uncharacterized protein (TIGR03435 family)